MTTTYLLICGSLGLWAGLVVNLLADRLPFGGLRARPPQGSTGLRRWRPPLVLLASSALFVYLGIRLDGASSDRSEFLLTAFYTGLLLLILIVDLEHRRVLNIVVGPAALFGLLVALLGSLSALGIALGGGLAGFVLFLTVALLRPGAMGAGDVKLAGLIGILLGFPGVILALSVGILLGGVGTIGLLLTRRVSLRSHIPYAPFLAVGAWIAMIYGPQILAWYGQRLGL